jgi:hypothetical protein
VWRDLRRFARAVHFTVTPKAIGVIVGSTPPYGTRIVRLIMRHDEASLGVNVFVRSGLFSEGKHPADSVTGTPHPR